LFCKRPQDQSAGVPQDNAGPRRKRPHLVQDTCDNHPDSACAKQGSQEHQKQTFWSAVSYLIFSHQITSLFDLLELFVLRVVYGETYQCMAQDI